MTNQLLHLAAALKIWITWGSSWRFAWAYSAGNADIPDERPDYERLVREWEDHYRRVRRVGVHCFVEIPGFYAGEIIHIAWSGMPGGLFKWQGSRGYVRCPDARTLESRA